MKISYDAMMVAIEEMEQAANDAHKIAETHLMKARATTGDLGKDYRFFSEIQADTGRRSSSRKKSFGRKNNNNTSQPNSTKSSILI